MFLFFCVFEFQSKLSATSTGKILMWKYTFYQPYSRSLIIWTGPSTIHSPNPLLMFCIKHHPGWVWFEFTGSCVESEMQRDVFFLFRGVPGLWSGWRRYNQAQCPGGKSDDNMPTVKSLHKTWIRVSGVKSTTFASELSCSWSIMVHLFTFHHWLSDIEGIFEAVLDEVFT